MPEPQDRDEHDAASTEAEPPRSDPPESGSWLGHLLASAYLKLMLGGRDYLIGLGCGFFLGLIGVIGCYLLGKPETKQGSLHGLVARILVGGLALLVVALTQ